MWTTLYSVFNGHVHVHPYMYMYTTTCTCTCVSLGRRVKRVVEEYEYDKSLDPLYQTSMLKQFNKTLTDGYFAMIIVDAINNKVCVCVCVFRSVCHCKLKEVLCLLSTCV